MLVHVDRCDALAGANDLRDQLRQRVVLALQLRDCTAERQQQRRDVLLRERKRRLHHRAPLLEPVFVHVLELLDVHHGVAHLHGSVAVE